MCVRRHKYFSRIISFSQHSKASRSNLVLEIRNRLGELKWLDKVNTQAGLQTQLYVTLNTNLFAPRYKNNNGSKSKVKVWLLFLPLNDSVTLVKSMNTWVFSLTENINPCPNLPQKIQKGTNIHVSQSTVELKEIIIEM